MRGATADSASLRPLVDREVKLLAQDVRSASFARTLFRACYLDLLFMWATRAHAYHQRSTQGWDDVRTGLRSLSTLACVNRTFREEFDHLVAEWMGSFEAAILRSSLWSRINSSLCSASGKFVLLSSL